MDSREPSKCIARRSCKNLKDYNTRVGKFFTYEPCGLLDVCVGTGKHAERNTKAYFKERFKMLKKHERKRQDA